MIDALYNRKLIRRNPDLDCGYELTDAGHALYEEDAMRQQTTADFTLQQDVEVLEWQYSGHAVQAVWQPATIIKITPRLLTLQYPAGQIARQMPTHVRPAQWIPRVGDQVQILYESTQPIGYLYEIWRGVYNNLRYMVLFENNTRCGYWRSDLQLVEASRLDEEAVLTIFDDNGKLTHMWIRHDENSTS